MAHYGHFLVEMLSAFWTYETFHSFDHFVLQPFAYGTQQFPRFLLDALRAFGVPPEKIVLIGSPIKLAEVVIPERLVKFHHSANIHVRQVYRHLRDYYTPQAKDSLKNPGRRYYISRVKTSLSIGGRTIANEAAIENKLLTLGFTLVYPEALSLPEQIRLFAEADVICGIGGSGMHNVLFMRENSLLVEIGDARTRSDFEPMQDICNALAQVKTAFIPFSGRILDEENALCWVDAAQVVSRLRAALVSHDGGAGIDRVIADQIAIPPNSYSAYVGLRLVIKSVLRLAKWRLRRMFR